MHRLFIVEDEAIIAMDLSEQLEEMGYDVVGVAYDGQDALDQLSELNPDLILMDIVLGTGIDGIETAERIMANRSIPVIFLTAFSDSDTISRAVKTAPYGYVTKPYNAQALKATIEIALTKFQLEHRLHYKERWFSNILHAVHDGIVAVGLDGCVHFANEEACKILQLSSAQEIIEKDLFSQFTLCDHDGNEVTTSPVSEAMQRNTVLGITFGGSIRNRLGGERIFIDYTAAPVRSKSKNLIGAVFAIRDAGKRLSIEHEIRNSPNRFHEAFNKSSVGIALVSFNHDIIDYNRAFSETFSLSEGTRSLNILEDILKSTADRNNLKEGLLPLVSGLVQDVKIDLQVQNGEYPVWVQFIITLLHDDATKPAYYLYQVFNYTDQKIAEEKLQHRLHYDPVTGLITLPQVKQEISRVLDLCHEDDGLIAVITIDIDGFRTINNQHGMETAQSLLTELAQRLSDIGFFSQFVGRDNHDRFIMVLYALESISQAMYTANRTLEEINEPFYTAHTSISVTACMGISMAPDDGTDEDTLLNRSNDALVSAKMQGRNQIAFYSRKAVECVNQRMSNEARISYALNNRQMECRLMPLTGQDTHYGYRAACYWPEEDRYFSQGSFLDIASCSDLSCQMTEWLAEQAVSEMKPDNALLVIPLFASVLCTQRLSSALATLLDTNGVPAERLVLEIPEHQLSDNSLSEERLQHFRKQGFRICLRHEQSNSLTINFLYRTKPDYYLVPASNRHHNQPDYLSALAATINALSATLILEGDVPQPAQHDAKNCLRTPQLSYLEQLSH